MKQIKLFDTPGVDDSIYTAIAEKLLYLPRGPKPNIILLYDKTKTTKLIAEISSANIPDDEKQFLILAAYRHTVFNYQLIAEYYAHSAPEIQKLMERSALILIDINSAIQNNYITLSDVLFKLYLEEDNNDSTG